MSSNATLSDLAKLNVARGADLYAVSGTSPTAVPRSECPVKERQDEFFTFSFASVEIPPSKQRLRSVLPVAIGFRLKDAFCVSGNSPTLTVPSRLGCADAHRHTFPKGLRQKLPAKAGVVEVRPNRQTNWRGGRLVNRDHQHERTARQE